MTNNHTDCNKEVNTKISQIQPVNLDAIIKYMENTKEESWQTDTCRSQDGEKHCFFSHLFNMGGNHFWQVFESLFATEFMMFPVNDGKDERYQQPTIKERCIAYLKDLRDGKEKTSSQMWDEM